MEVESESEGRDGESVWLETAEAFIEFILSCNARDDKPDKPLYPNLDVTAIVDAGQLLESSDILPNLHGLHEVSTEACDIRCTVRGLKTRLSSTTSLWRSIPR